jgi:hypothetical protein
MLADTGRGCGRIVEGVNAAALCSSINDLHGAATIHPPLILVVEEDKLISFQSAFDSIYSFSFEILQPFATVLLSQENVP